MKQKICFVIMGFGKKTDYSTGNTFDLDKTYKNIIKPSAEKCGYRCVRADEIQKSSIIDRNMYALLLCSNLVIADISTYNPNAIYELGVRHAIKPYHTIILKEKEGDLPFDLNHNSIMLYKHLGDDIGVDESNRCIKKLTNMIEKIEHNKQADSPFYEYMKTAIPPKVSQEEIDEIIEDLSKKSDSVFVVVEEAKILMKNKKFKEAAEFWHKASEIVTNESYYIQQEALCTYKSKHPSEIMALNNASIIINKLLKGDNAIDNDPETFGIAGAIYKNMYLYNEDLSILNKAIKYYGAGFNIRKDYYNGENYALCLDIKASKLQGEEAIYNRMLAKKTREEIIEIISEILSKGIDDRDDIRWIYATLANCYYSIMENEKGDEYEEKFKKEVIYSWELDTYYKNKEELLKLLDS